MNLDLTPEQEEILTVARRFLEKECSLTVVTALEKDPLGYSAKLWAEMAGLGWLALPIPEAYGGSELATVDVVTLAREMGRVVLPSPFIPTVLLAGGALAALGDEEQKQHYLPRIARGEAILGFAVQEVDGGIGPRGVAATARVSDGGFVLNGRKRFVEFAAASERLMVVARSGEAGPAGTGGLGLFLVDPRSPGVSVNPIQTLARDRQCHVALDNVRVAKSDVVGTPGQVWTALEPVIQRAVLAFSAGMLGASERAQELGKDYACQRVQFGRPIASFQVIQHYLAQMVIENTAVETLIYYAAWNLDKGNPARAEVARAKIGAGNAVKFASSRSAEIYGGMGFVDEVDISYYLRRGKQWQLQMGDPRYWEEVLISALFDRAEALQTA
ncbi:MAG: acyl-CoA dehydrogenase [Gammaproteobacteria bacterium]|nr:MAG: acyl-CoA dehydrogenase [Gammaproteobacteria bacterium]